MALNCRMNGLDRFLARIHVEDDVARDDLLRPGERAVGEAPALKKAASVKSRISASRAGRIHASPSKSAQPTVHLFDQRMCRIGMARKVMPDFGIAMFCGLGRAPGAAVPSGTFANAVVPVLRRATPETIEDVLDLHRAAASL